MQNIAPSSSKSMLSASMGTDGRCHRCWHLSCTCSSSPASELWKRWFKSKQVWTRSFYSQLPKSDMEMIADSTEKCNYWNTSCFSQAQRVPYWTGTLQQAELSWTLPTLPVPHSILVTASYSGAKSSILPLWQKKQKSEILAALTCI